MLFLAAMCSVAFAADAATDGIEWENAYAALKLDDGARVVSLREKATGRELAASPEPFFRAEFSDGKLEVPSTARLTADGLLEVLFAGLFAFVFDWADIGIYIGIVCGMSFGSIIAFIYVNYYLKKHESYFN